MFYMLNVWINDLTAPCLVVGMQKFEGYIVQKIHRVISTISVMGFLLQKTCFKGRFNHEESTVDDALHIGLIFIEFISRDKR